MKNLYQMIAINLLMSTTIVAIDPYDSLKTILPYDDHGWFVNGKFLKGMIEEKKPKIVVEIGVWLGQSAMFMASLLGDDCKLYAVDHWQGSPEWFNTTEDVRRRIPSAYEQFLSNVIHKKLTHVIVPIKMSSVEACKSFNHMADFIFIDGSHEEKAVYDDIINWYEKLNTNGIMCGDDWSYPGVKKAVTRTAQELNLKFTAIDNFWYFDAK